MQSRIKTNEVEIESRGGAILLFQNYESEDDCAIGFTTTTWHAHGDLMFVDGRGNYVEVDSLDILTGLKNGSLLICELWRDDQLCDRWLIDRDYHDELKHLGKGEKIKIYRF